MEVSRCLGTANRPYRNAQGSSDPIELHAVEDRLRLLPGRLELAGGSEDHDDEEVVIGCP
jgi:hypothetical protein